MIMRGWALDGCREVASRQSAWRVMRRTLGLSKDVHPKTIRHTVATLLYADPTVPEREIVELLGHEGKLARTTRIYAKYDPNRLANVTRVLTMLWRQIHRLAKAYASDHILTTHGSGHRIVIASRPGKC
jgi:integrase